MQTVIVVYTVEASSGDPISNGLNTLKLPGPLPLESITGAVVSLTGLALHRDMETFRALRLLLLVL